MGLCRGVQKQASKPYLPLYPVLGLLLRFFLLVGSWSSTSYAVIDPSHLFRILSFGSALFIFMLITVTELACTRLCPATQSTTCLLLQLSTVCTNTLDIHAYRSDALNDVTAAGIPAQRYHRLADSCLVSEVERTILLLVVMCRVFNR
jgi:hypothetical protein